MTEAKNEHVCPICEAVAEFRSTDAYKHLRSAKKEFLLAVRSVLDRRITRLSDDAEGQ